MSTRHDLVEDPELEGVLILLSLAVVGQPEEDTGKPIDSYGVGSNAAVSFSNKTFALRDYCWCEGERHPEIPRDDPEDWAGDPTCPPNFEHFASGITGTWYKYLGRNTRFSREARQAHGRNEALDILTDCLASLGHTGHRWTDWAVIQQPANQ